MEDYLDLHKALSAEDRDTLLVNAPATGERALALIDALGEHLAEAVARMTVAEGMVSETTDEALRSRVEYWREQFEEAMRSRVIIEQAWNNDRAERDAALARAEAAEEKAGALLPYPERAIRAEKKERAAWDEVNASRAHANTARRARERQTARLKASERSAAEADDILTMLRPYLPAGAREVVVKVDAWHSAHLARITEGVL